MARARDGTIRVTGTDDLRRLALDLRAQADGRQRVRQLTTELRRAVRPLARRASTGALSLPSRGWNATHGVVPLRKNLAKSVTISVTTKGQRAGVRLYMNPRKMPAGKRQLFKYVEGVPGWQRWRHPLFGNENVWFSQRSHPFFTRAVESGEQQARSAVEIVINRVVRDLENG